jgi:hypothetical protein
MGTDRELCDSTNQGTMAKAQAEFPDFFMIDLMPINCNYCYIANGCPRQANAQRRP